MLRICICDDRSEDNKILQEYAEAFSKEHPEFPLKADAFTSPYELLQAVGDRGGYDIYLLDIIMPKLSGIEIAERIRARGERAEILFLTISREYAIEAFGVKASGYLMKPVKRRELEEALLHCIHNLAPKENPAILLKTRKGMRKVQIREIVTIESFNHSRICTLVNGTSIETPATLTSLYEQLSRYPGFFVPHRAYIVNLDYICGLTSTELLLTDGRRIPVSRNIYPKLKATYLDYCL